ncbi:hypothetical protein K438DRAFT_2092122 [Mycena galopus ATCC 62051]|nr:hypothetical protein K438DRAFT_2092122 [Mycena galopus ATCC 62051]
MSIPGVADPERQDPSIFVQDQHLDKRIVIGFCVFFSLAHSRCLLRMSDLGTILEILPCSRPPSPLSYAESNSQRTTIDTSTVWGPGTLSGRALLTLGEVAIRGISNLIIRRRLAAICLRVPSLNRSMCDDLLELCRPKMYPKWIGKEAVRLISAQICLHSKYYVLVVALCKWPQEEARLIILELIRSLPGLRHPPRWQLSEFYNFLAVIIQVREQWRTLIVEAAHLFRSVLHDGDLPVDHPIDMLCTKTAPQSTPLSKKSRSFKMPSIVIWMNLQAAGLPLDACLRDVISILTTADKSTFQFRDARVFEFFSVVNGQIHALLNSTGFGRGRLQYGDD